MELPQRPKCPGLNARLSSWCMKSVRSRFSEFRLFAFRICMRRARAGGRRRGTRRRTLPSPPPTCPRVRGVPGQCAVVKDSFSSFLGLAGPAHCWGGAAAVERISASDPSLELGLPLLVTEPRRGGEIWIQDGRSRGHLHRRTGSGPEST